MFVVWYSTMADNKRNETDNGHILHHHPGDIKVARTPVQQLLFIEGLRDRA